MLASSVLMPGRTLAQAMKLGEPAPNFAVKSLRGDRTIHLSDFRGRRVLIFAWASW
jgi:peroxiredoxin